MSATRRARHLGAWPAVLALVVAAACGASDDAPSDTTTTAGTAAATSAATPTATTPAPTGSSMAPTTSTGMATSGVTTTSGGPPSGCVEREPSRPLTVDLMTEAALAGFRSLTSAPGIELVVDHPGVAPTSAVAVEVDRIPGGLLVISQPGSSATSDPNAPAAVLTAVDWDGTVRWVRCLTDGYPSAHVAPSGDRPDAVVIGTESTGSSTFRRTWTALSLLDGRPVPAVAERFAASGEAAATGLPVSSTTRWLLLQPEPPRTDAAYVTVNLATSKPTAVPYPTDIDLRGAVAEIDDAGTVTAYAGSPQAAVVAQWRDGRWVPGASATIPTRVVFPFGVDGAGAELSGIEGNGRVLWSVADRRHPGLEATGVYRDGDLAMAQTCEPQPDPNRCVYRLTAVDVATGAVRWELPGLRLVAATPAGGAALVSEGDVGANMLTWRLISTTSGAPVPGQLWADADAFNRTCCGDAEFNTTSRDGAVVVVVQGRRVRVWLPDGVALPGWTSRLP